VLSEIPGNKDEELMEIIEIGDLSMFPKNETVINLDELCSLKLAHGAPECTLRTPWLRTDLGSLCIKLTIIDKVDQAPEDNLSLSGREAERYLQEISHLIKKLIKELR
jgi:hypothetical protein